MPELVTRRRSETTRLVAVLVRRAVSCGCARAPSIGLLQGSDRQSHERAQVLRDRITTARHDMKVFIEPAEAAHALGSSRAHRCVCFDVTASAAGVARLGFRWEPDQPERGRLAVVTDGVDVTLTPGTGLDVRPANGVLVVDTIDDRNGRTSRLATTTGTVEVQDLDGGHLLFRDEHCDHAAPTHVRLAIDHSGAVRRC